MCGICGIYHFKNKSVDADKLKLMNNSMNFRGPDGEGYLIKGNFGMGMKRLSIIDIKNGNQPISNYRKDVHIILNGEIYNYIELKNELVNEGYLFQTESDTEVLLNLYLKYGENFIKYINGMFSFCIYDERNKKILLYRDRLGIKPLYYFKNDNIFLFSSNLDSLISFDTTLKEIEENSIFLYLHLNYVPADVSIRKNVSKLLPGHYIKIYNNNIEIKKYWELPKDHLINKKKLDFDEIETLLIEIVKIQTRTHVNFGSFLSGGIDSSIITYLAHKNVKKFNTYTANFLNKCNEDSLYAKRISEEFGLSNFQIDINNNNLEDDIKLILPFLDEPISDSAIFSTYKLSKFASNNGEKVILTGAGGDEVFGGYKRHEGRNFFYYLIPNIPLEKILLMSSFLKDEFLNYILKIFCKELDYVLGASGTSVKFLNDINKNKNNFFTSLKDIQNIIRRNSIDFSKKKKRMKVDLLNYLPDNILTVTDKMSMACSIEARTPFLDHRLIELINKTNTDSIFDIGNQQKKKILYNIFHKKINLDIWSRKKEGFNSGINNFIFLNKSRLINYFNEIENPYLDKIIDFKKINNYLSKINNISIYSQSIFSTYLLARWIKKYD